MNEKGASGNVTGRARYTYGGKSRVAIQGDDESTDGNGFHVGRFYQMSKMPMEIEAEIRKLQDGNIDCLNIFVVCVRIEELRKQVGKSCLLRSSESKKNLAATSAIVTEYLPASRDSEDYVTYICEKHINNVAPIPLASLGAEMEMQLLQNAGDERRCADNTLQYKCMRLIPGHGGEQAEPLCLRANELSGFKNAKGEQTRFLQLRKADLQALLKSHTVPYATANSLADLRLKLLHSIAKTSQQQELERQSREALFRQHTAALRMQYRTEEQARQAAAWEQFDQQRIWQELNAHAYQCTQLVVRITSNRSNKAPPAAAAP